MTSKPVIYAANIGEGDLGGDVDALPLVKKVEDIAKEQHAQVLVICASVEEEIAQMEPDEKQEFLTDMGIGKSGLDRLVSACYELLGLISFLTAGPKEVRAWTIERGTKAPQAAGKIHSDFERGFIRAEVVRLQHLHRRGRLHEDLQGKGPGALRGQGVRHEGRRHGGVPVQRIMDFKAEGLGRG